MRQKRPVTFDRIRIELRLCARLKRYSWVEYYQIKKIGKNWKMKMKNEEEKNRLLVEMCYM